MRKSTIFVLSVLLILYGAYSIELTCTGGRISNGFTCKYPNNNAGSCISVDVCFDTINGECSSFGKCVCKDGYMWVIGKIYKCLPISNGTMPCKFDYECGGNGICADGKCTCNSRLIWSSPSNICKTYNVGTMRNDGKIYPSTTCTSATKCIDSVRGICLTNRCTCMVPYIWNFLSYSCGLPNDGISSCSDDLQCFDHVRGNCVSNTCVCQPIFEWSNSSQRCLKANNGMNTCVRSDDCDDYTGFCQDRHCICNPSTKWDEPLHACIEVNIQNDGSPCTYSDQCADHINGACEGGICVCNSEFSWSPYKQKCIKPNVGDPYSCTNVHQCVDSKTGLCYNGFCICPSDTVFNTEKEQCLKVNDGISTCNSSDDCYDNTLGECVMGKCTCLTSNSGYGCAPLYENDGTVACTNSMQCLDSIYGKCSSTCKCLAGFIWKNQKCTKENNGISPCTSGFECVVNEFMYGGCYSGVCDCISYWDSVYFTCTQPVNNYGLGHRCTETRNCFDQVNGFCSTSFTPNVCICNTGWVFSMTLFKCIPPNNGQISCTTNADCFEPETSVCTSGKCNCAPGYYWGSFNCVLNYNRYNNGASGCSVATDCFDSDLGYCLQSYCVCRIGTYYSNKYNKCLYKNDGTNNCTGTHQCLDQTSGLCSGTCVCKSGMIWSEGALSCGRPNNGISICSNKNDCIDITNGDCFGGVCVCIVGVWSNFDSSCVTDNLLGNSGENKCKGIIDCIDNFNGICDGFCKCKLGYVYSGKYSRCGKMNDGIQPCISAFECLDLILGSCLSGKCTCKTGTSMTPTGECGWLNDGVNTCKSQDDCYIYSYPGACTRGVCTCESGYSWKAESKQCTNLKPNDNTQICASTLECADFTYGTCNTNCVCKDGFSWNVYQYSCRKPNDDTLPCLTRKECTDSVQGECIMGKCGCPKGRLWIESQRKCINCLIGCAKCSPVEVCLQCNPGYYLDKLPPDPNSCILCPVGSYSGTENVSCTLCPPGTYSNSLGSKYCLTCNGGTFSIANSSTCSPCAAGFTSNSDKTGCVNCPDGSTSVEGGSCVNCAPGQRSSNSHLACVSCVEGTYSVIPSNKCDPCSAGKSSAFPFTSCFDCPIGTISNEGGKCTPCGIGTEASPNHTVCVMCQRNFFSNETGSTCTPCPNGYASEPGASQCKIDCRIFSQFSQEGLCVEKCSKGYYANAARLCVKCNSNCEVCTAEICNVCIPGLYLYGNECYSLENRPNGVFIRITDKAEFIPCAIQCKSCTGPTSDECVECNSNAGYVLLTSKKCGIPKCNYGYFAPSVINPLGPFCVRCHDSCLTCTNSGPENCLTCRNGYMMTRSSSKIFCKKCEEINSGFTLDSTGTKCVEMCGDGKNLNEIECDDANTNSGDGCSQDCKIEPNFICVKRAGLPDYCYSTLPPVPKLTVLTSNKVAVVEFSRPIVYNSYIADELNSSIKVNLEKMKSECKLDWSLMNSSLESISELRINLNMNCTVYGATEYLAIAFAKPWILTDENGVPMQEEHAKASLHRFRYLSLTEKATIASTGVGLSSMNIIIIVISAARYLVQSVALGSFWSLMNMLQLIYYTTAMNIYIPFNFKQFSIDYLSLSLFQFPLPNLISINWINRLNYDTGIDNLRDFGISSYCFLYNFFQQLSTWAAIALFYGVLCILDNILPEKRFLFVRKWKKEYTYNAVIRILLESFMELSFVSLINITFLRMDTVALTTSYIAAIIATAFAFLFFSFCLYMTSTLEEDYEADEFKDQFSSLIEEFKEKDGPFCRGYYCIFLIKRYAFAMILVLAHEYAIFQISSTIALDLLMFSYLIYFKPFKSNIDFFVNCFNEFGLIVIHTTILGIRLTSTEETSHSQIIGWIDIGVIMISVLQIWVITMSPLFRQAFLIVKQLCFGRTEEVPQESHELAEINLESYDEKTMGRKHGSKKKKKKKTIRNNGRKSGKGSKNKNKKENKNENKNENENESQLECKKENQESNQIEEKIDGQKDGESSITNLVNVEETSNSASAEGAKGISATPFTFRGEYTKAQPENKSVH